MRFTQNGHRIVANKAALYMNILRCVGIRLYMIMQPFCFQGTIVDRC